MPGLTPIQRYDLVTRSIEQVKTLGLLLVPITSGRPWLVDGEAVRTAYNNLAQTVRELNREVDWPGPRPLEETDTNGNTSTTPRE